MIVDTVVGCHSWYMSTKTLNVFFFFLITSGVDTSILIISVINSTITIISQIDGIYKILIMFHTINDILIHTLNTKISNGYILNTRETILIAVVHYDEVDRSIRKADGYHAIIIVVDKIDIIINAIDASVISAIIHKISSLNIIYNTFQVLILEVYVDVCACGTFYYRSQGIDTIDADTAQIDVSGITSYELGIIESLTLKF